MNVAGAVKGLATGYGSLNVNGTCICDGVHSISNLEWIIRLNGCMKVLGIPLDGDVVGYPGGGSLASGL